MLMLISFMVALLATMFLLHRSKGVLARSMFAKTACLFLAALVLLAPEVSWAAAAVDTDIAGAIDTFDLTWVDIKTSIIAILLFVVGWKLIKKWLKA